MFNFKKIDYFLLQKKKKKIDYFHKCDKMKNQILDLISIRLNILCPKPENPRPKTFYDQNFIVFI